VALNIKNQEVEKLVNDLVQITGESKTEAVRKALEERRQRLAMSSVVRQDAERLLLFLREEVWPQVPEAELGKRLTKEQEEEILGYGEAGV
jgi:antitoxin VapB